ncbi:MAG TPA: hypothetical protein VGQ37_24680 [Vicinamibacterales bacterium]|jgi:hypothetical protein|nr:hypothetical protein [Vicinamibacterales bacterium]
MAQLQALRQAESEQQLALQGLRWPAARPAARARVDARNRHTPLCAGCRAKEARYGFRADGVEAGTEDRPRTLCFDCFRIEIDRRRRVAEQLARGWNAAQVGLPLEDTLNELSLRRRRAQIAARHALNLS